MHSIVKSSEPAYVKQLTRLHCLWDNAIGLNSDQSPTDRALNDADKVTTGLYRGKKKTINVKIDRMMAYSSLPPPTHTTCTATIPI